MLESMWDPAANCFGVREGYSWEVCWVPCGIVGSTCCGPCGILGSTCCGPCGILGSTCWGQCEILGVHVGWGLSRILKSTSWGPPGIFLMNISIRYSAPLVILCHPPTLAHCNHSPLLGAVGVTLRCSNQLCQHDKPKVG